MKRRELLKTAGLFTLMAGAGIPSDLFARDDKKRWKIGACDWSLGKGGDPTAFQVAKEIGLDGVQVSLGSLANDMHLRKPEIQEQYRKASAQTGVAISSLAIGELNNTPYKSDPRTEQWVSDSIDVARALNVNVVLLAFFSKNDLRNDEAGKKEVVRRLKKVAAKAEKNKVILGLETYLSAEELADIIQQVGSKSIKVYYDFRNSVDAGYDIAKEIEFLGRKAICELHMKENGHLLGEGSIDWQLVRQKLADVNYRGNNWMQIEGAVPDGADLVKSYKHNLKFLNSIFNA